MQQHRRGSGEPAQATSRDLLRPILRRMGSTPSCPNTGARSRMST
jgi:hypothetical protein